MKTVDNEPYTFPKKTFTIFALQKTNSSNFKKVWKILHLYSRSQVLPKIVNHVLVEYKIVDNLFKQL